MSSSSNRKRNQRRAAANKNAGQKKQNQPKKQEEEREEIVLKYDDGNTEVCEILGVFDCQGRDYVALVSDENPDDVYIYRYNQTGEEDYTLEDETDEAKFDAAVREFEALMGHTRNA